MIFVSMKVYLPRRIYAYATSNRIDEARVCGQPFNFSHSCLSYLPLPKNPLLVLDLDSFASLSTFADIVADFLLSLAVSLFIGFRAGSCGLSLLPVPCNLPLSLAIGPILTLATLVPWASLAGQHW